ncbi:MAG: FAD-dependent oxidoreductase [Candidatus Omnitrophica bacterium]|nr:FAD-dependent oxidoreductase [Candidatus Omnitrophota bacterium]
MPKHVVILGAGPAGLSSALGLIREGIDVDILEMGSQVGGLCRSTHKDGYIFDLGGHRLITKDDLLLVQIEELVGTELLVRPRKSVIRLQDKFFNYPLEIFDVLKKLHPAISFKSTVDFFLTWIGAYSKLSDASFENWVIKRFGRTMYDIYFGPYSEKLWGMPPSKISSKWASQRVSLNNFTDVLLRALGKKKNMPKTYAASFLYPKRGIGQIFERMAEEIEKGNGRVHLNAKVTKVILKNNFIERIFYRQGDEVKDVSGDFVISTIPLPEFILSIEPRPADKYLSLAQTMSFRCIKFIHIMLDKERITDNTWIYVPEAKYIFFRIQDRRNWSPTAVPEKKNALTLEIACNKNDAIWTAPDKEIFQRCIRDLEELNIIRRSEVIGYFSEKIEHAYPIYSLDYQEKTKVAYEVIAGINDFISIGRQGLFRYNNMDHSLKMGFLTSEHILRNYPRQKIFEIATEDIIFDWQDPGSHGGRARITR